MQQAAFKTRLHVNRRQATYFAQACGTSRFVWNWGLAEWNKQYLLYKEGKQDKPPNGLSLKKQLNSIKKEKYPWMSEVTKYAAQQPFLNLNKAWQSFFGSLKHKGGRKCGAPKFKKKGRCKDSFYVGGDQLKVDSKKLCVPCLGWVKMAEPLRFAGKMD